MKKLSFLLALVLLVTVAGCRKQEDLPEVEQPPVEDELIALWDETLGSLRSPN